MSGKSLSERRAHAIARGVGVATPLFAESASNAELWDSEGRRYIDFAAGIAVVNTGHCHPQVMEMARQQLDQFTHICHQVVSYESYVKLAERLNELVPVAGPTKTVFVTTGAEAVENAVKIARAATGRSGVIAFSGAFHGRTFMTMALTGKAAPYKTGFGPLMGDVWRIPFPAQSQGVSVAETRIELDRLFKTDIAPTRVAAMIVEPVQGEGGFHPAPPELMRMLREVADEHGIVLIADEIQTGFGRTGKLFAMQHFDVQPDLITMAKGLAGGFPLAAVTGRADLMDAPVPGGLGGTFAGNPVATAAANAVLDVMEQEQLPARAERLGSQLVAHLTKIRPQVPQISDIRGLGLMQAVEFTHPGSSEPDASFADTVRAQALESGLILLNCGTYGNAIRFLPPLTIEQSTFDEALKILEAVLIRLAGESR
ncbi:MAG: 4-aminobutyrate--2-oxoglutarate transaminase [Lautropia sp.]|nr:4-aminobutyrate--2-oxoglutarate transaminase [Lautropia sp.]